MAGMPRPDDLLSTERTTIQIYREDHDWLLARQRSVSFRRNETVPMFDLVHELIKAVWIDKEGE